MNDDIILKCPYCASEELERIQSTDMLNHLNTLTDMRELWQCLRCGGYVIAHYKLIKITELREIHENNRMKLEN